MSDINLPEFFPIRNGRLALWHRPSIKSLPRIKAAGCEVVVTLMCAREGGSEICSAVRFAGLQSMWVPIERARPLVGKEDEDTRRGIAHIADKLVLGGCVLIHCSAGLHRTGMVTIALMKVLGYTKNEALMKLEMLRSRSFEEMTDERLSWAWR